MAKTLYRNGENTVTEWQKRCNGMAETPGIEEEDAEQTV